MINVVNYVEDTMKSTTYPALVSINIFRTKSHPATDVPDPCPKNIFFDLNYDIHSNYF